MSFLKGKGEVIPEAIAVGALATLSIFTYRYLEKTDAAAAIARIPFVGGIYLGVTSIVEGAFGQ